VIVSAGGLSAGETREELLATLPRVGDRLRVPAETLRTASEAMRHRQVIYPQSGGTHAAGIFDAEGQVLAFAEDIGRHNALDKAVGKCLLAGRSTAGCGAALSGRVSLEMVTKCARAGLEIISAVSAPTSLACEAARRCNITLCATVRDNKATVFTHPQRILDA
jgi:FdhD protein